MASQPQCDITKSYKSCIKTCQANGSPLPAQVCGLDATPRDERSPCDVGESSAKAVFSGSMLVFGRVCNICETERLLVSIFVSDLFLAKKFFEFFRFQRRLQDFSVLAH